MTRSTWIAALALLGLVGPAPGGDATVPGEVTTPYPTLINLGVEWQIEGDDNENGRVAVRFRAVGDSDWREAMPLRLLTLMHPLHLNWPSAIKY